MNRNKHFFIIKRINKIKLYNCTLVLHWLQTDVTKQINIVYTVLYLHETSKGYFGNTSGDAPISIKTFMVVNIL